jgi:glycosyltransferase involved in cell wall biosynthesis
MKLLFIVPRYHINLYYPLEALQHAGYDVHLAVLYRGGSEKVDTVIPHEIGSVVSPRKIPSPIALFKTIYKTQPEVIFIRGFRSWFTVISLLVACTTRRRIMLLVQTDKHDGIGWYRRMALFVLTKLVRVERIISPLKNTLPTHNPLYVYAPFTITPSYCAPRAASSATRILTVGKFQPRKGHRLLLGVIQQLLANGEEVVLTLVGEAHDAEEEAKIRAYITDAGLTERVTIVSHLSHDAVRALYCQHDLFVLPSWNEPAAFSPLEAMAAGLPVIVSDTCGTKCYLEVGANGYHFKSGDANDLFEKIITVIHEDTAALGARSQVLVAEQHIPAQFVTRLATILNSEYETNSPKTI